MNVAETTVIVTMAGVGRRFQEAGYQQPKYRIEAAGKSLFRWSQQSLAGWARQGSRFLYLTRAGEDTASFLAAECRALGIRDWAEVAVEGSTPGQASTARLAADQLRDHRAPVAIFNIDTYVCPEALDPSGVRGAGWIPCFEAPGEHWSFARVDPEDRVLEVREKRRISPHATVGFYWFESFEVFEQAYRATYLEADRREAGERYVAPLYNHLIQQGRTCFLGRVPAEGVACFGTPDELEAFEARQVDPGAGPR